MFDIDWQGADQISAKAPDDSVRIFILPPSWLDLSRRLHARAQDSATVIQQRLELGKREIEHWTNYDYVIVNKDFDRAYADLVHIYRAERMKPGRNPWLPPFVDDLLAEKL
jgi:guanylate kinase